MVAHEIGADIFLVESDTDIVVSDLELHIDLSHYRNVVRDVQRALCNL